MICRIRLLASIYLLISLNSVAQDQVAEIIIDQYLPEQGTELDSESLVDGIQSLYDNPVNLNSATREEFERLFFIDDRTIEALINHREKYGEFITIYELAYVKEISHETLDLILPFIRLSSSGNNDKPLFKSIVDSEKRSLARYSRKLVGVSNQQNGKEESEYVGSSDHIFGRISIHEPGRLKLGFSYEKDAGEQIRWDIPKKQFGFDHYSFHFMIASRNIVKKVLFGDYKLLFGQGLIQGSGFSLGKGMDPVASVRKKGQTIRPHTGSAEYGYLRGITFELDLDPFQVTTYSSYNKSDALIQGQDSGDDIPSVRSIIKTGLHRNEREIDWKNQLPQWIIGVNADYRNKSRDFLVGITTQITKFGYSVIPEKRIYNQFDFLGRNNMLGSIHLQYRHKDMFFFSEGAMAGNKAVAFIAGIIGNISDHLETTFLIRNYGKRYHAFDANGFGESDQTRNEHGLYWGIRIKPISNLELNLYYDHFKFPWLRYRSYAPSEGYDTQLRINYRLNRNSSFYFQFRQKEKEHNIIMDGKVYGIENMRKRSFRANWSYKPETGIRINSRIQWSNSHWNDTTTNGICLVQDIGLYGKRISLISRFALFDTDDYENRQYVYENDVLHYYYIPAYSGKGIRNFLVFHYKVNRHVNTWLKIARTFQSDQIIDKSRNLSYAKWEIRTQVQLTF
ncbi:ComEA family DNA-binding protein [Bacteroidota bacterium]